MICLIRHGETDWNLQGRIQGKTDIPLNSTGIRQAEECSDYLKDRSFDVFISSPLIRARKTAEIINRHHQLPIIEMEEFKERSFGEAEGLTVEERERRYPDGSYTGQEELEAFRKRVMHAISKVNQQFAGKKVIVVAHGAVIGMILSTLSNGEIGTGKTKLINACINNIEFTEEEWKVHNYNQITHLTMYN